MVFLAFNLLDRRGGELLKTEQSPRIRLDSVTQKPQSQQNSIT
jgi:hypothetical protein